MMPSKAYLTDTLGTSFCSVPELHFYRRHCPHPLADSFTLPRNKRFNLSFLNPFFLFCHVPALHKTFETDFLLLNPFIIFIYNIYRHKLLLNLWGTIKSEEEKTLVSYSEPNYVCALGVLRGQLFLVPWGRYFIYTIDVHIYISLIKGVLSQTI